MGLILKMPFPVEGYEAEYHRPGEMHVDFENEKVRLVMWAYKDLKHREDGGGQCKEITVRFDARLDPSARSIVDEALKVAYAAAKTDAKYSAGQDDASVPSDAIKTFAAFTAAPSYPWLPWAIAATAVVTAAASWIF